MPNSSSSTKVLVESALLAGLTAIIALIGMFIPVLNILTLLVTAVPIIIAVVRNDLRSGFLASIIAAFLIFILAGPVQAVFFYFQFMIMALAYGYMFKKKIGLGKILIIGTSITMISTIILFSLTFMLANLDWQQQKEMVLETVDQTIKVYEEKGLLTQLEEQGISKEDLRTNILDTIRLFLRVLPAILLLASMLSSLVSFVVSKFFLRKLGYDIAKFPPFSHWRLPWYAIWGLILGWGSYLLGDHYKIDILVILGQNLLIAYGLVLFILGLSVISYYFQKKRVSFLGRFLFILLVLILLDTMVMITLFIGMFDMVLDYRKLSPESIQKEEKKKKD